jgi:hypothetical protein
LLNPRATSQCFSSIVGPNGSGKSNVIDALLFVFGKRANQIRLKKISELIHNGSLTKISSCRVSIHFCDIIDHLVRAPCPSLLLSHAVYSSCSTWLYPSWRVMHVPRKCTF